MSARVVMYALLAGLALAASGADCDFAEDGGWQEGRTGLVALPVPVVADPMDLDATALRDACAAWAEGAALPPFECRVDGPAFAELEQGPAETDADYDARRIAGGYVRLWVANLGDDDDDPYLEDRPAGETWGLTAAHVSPVTGETVWADIRVSSAVAYDRATVQAVIAHELGEVVGLAHDGDLGSCMHDPPAVPCQVQPDDLRRAREGR